jgi:hypothetical protein
VIALSKRLNMELEWDGIIDDEDEERPVKRLRGKGLPWNLHTTYVNYDAVGNDFNMDDYVKVNCSRNCLHIYKCKHQLKFRNGIARQ